MTPEAYEKERVKVFLDEIGAYHFWPVQSGYGSATIDCLACVQGYFVGIEVKKPGYVPSNFTRRQLVAIDRIAKAGGKVFTGDGFEITRDMAQWLMSVPAAGK